MPYGYERLNERSQRPNVLINFIKPLDGPDKSVAEDMLNRIAAQCYPIMRSAHISVMSLEEFPANKEFLGRNFNAGECIQLVLKDKQGRWLSLNFVQMVMMHELAHCSQMNHSKYFWKVRNQYADEMKALWQRKYQGEGVWGRGRSLSTGGYVLDREIDQTDIPEQLCGGSYRRRGRKRKRGAQADKPSQDLTYAERQQKRIARKFGKHGQGNALGEDDLVRGALEIGHRHTGKPKVANSKRGRELRAQAALARFGSASQTVKEEQPADSGSVDLSDETESEDGEALVHNTGSNLAFHGKDYVKTCDGGETDDAGANQERDEMRTMIDRDNSKIEAERSTHSLHPSGKENVPAPLLQPNMSRSPMVPNDTSDDDDERSEKRAKKHVEMDSTKVPEGKPPRRMKTEKGEEDEEGSLIERTAQLASNLVACKVCSLEHDPQTLLCIACSNVMRPGLIKDTWRCKSTSCRSSGYVNAGDVGRCGICGDQRPAKSSFPTVRVGTVSSDILRWD